MWLLPDKGFSNNHWFKKWKIYHLDFWNDSFPSKWSFPNSAFELDGRLVSVKSLRRPSCSLAARSLALYGMDLIKLKGRFKKTQFHLKKKSKHISSNLQFYFLKGSKSKSTTWSRCELHSVKEDHKLINGDYLTNKWTQQSTCSILYCEWHFENEVQQSYMDHRFPSCNHITIHNTM